MFLHFYGKNYRCVNVALFRCFPYSDVHCSDPHCTGLLFEKPWKILDNLFKSRYSSTGLWLVHYSKGSVIWLSEVQLQWGYEYQTFDQRNHSVNILYLFSIQMDQSSDWHLNTKLLVAWTIWNIKTMFIYKTG